MLPPEVIDRLIAASKLTAGDFLFLFYMKHQLLVPHGHSQELSWSIWSKDYNSSSTRLVMDEWCLSG